MRIVNLHVVINSRRCCVSENVFEVLEGEEEVDKEDVGRIAS